jgi:hypothetical protein
MCHSDCNVLLYKIYLNIVRKITVIIHSVNDRIEFLIKYVILLLYTYTGQILALDDIIWLH